MRVTDANFYLLYLNAFGTSREAIDRAARQLADGKAVRLASDDPAGARATLALRSRLAGLAGFERSGEMARFDLATVESVLGGVFDLLTEARNKAMAGPSPGSDGAILADGVDQLRQQLIDFANTSQSGRHLFGGTETLTQPFDTSGAYYGNDDDAQVPIETGRTVGSTFSGQRVFLDGGDLFTTLDDLSVALRNDDNAAIDALIPVLTAALSHVSEIRADAGIRIESIDSTATQQSDEKLRLQQRISEIEDVPLERTAIELRLASSSLDALSTSAARVLGRSLFDYLG